MELNESIKQATLSFRHKINHNIRITCPECSHRRKGSNKTEPVMAVLIKEDRLIYDCKHCGVNGCAPLKNTTPPRIRLKPDEKKRAEEGVLTPLSMEYLTSNRKISKQVLKDHGIYSTQVFFPKLEKKVEAIGFPYLQDGEVYATKFRAVEAKAHTQNGGGANTLFGEHLIMEHRKRLARTELILVKIRSFPMCGMPESFLPGWSASSSQLMGISQEQLWQRS